MKTAISVVIPSFNGQTLLAKHVPRLLPCLEPGDEVLVVDDAGTDTTPEWIAQQAPRWQERHGIVVRCLRHETNRRFAAAVNTGMAAAQHPYVFLLNNDVHPVTPDIRTRLLSWFADPSLFAVGCGEVTSDEPDAPLAGRGTGSWQRGLFVHWFDPDQRRHETLWTAGGSMMVDRQKFHEIGGMDTLFRPAYEEDRDLSYRALKHGWTLLFDYDSRVLHQHESTNAAHFGRRRMQVMSWKNQYLLVWKNITDVPLLLEHILWLPYHVLYNGWRTRWASTLGFLAALRQAPECFARRRQAQQSARLSDAHVLSQKFRYNTL